VTGQARPILLFVVNDPAFFVSHRGRLALAATAEGYDVRVASPQDEAAVGAIQGLGVVHHAIALSRWGSRPASELRSILAIAALFRRVRPAVVHLVGIKAMIYGGIAARWTRVPAAVFAVSGLGHVFLSRGLLASARRALVRALYRIALGHPNARVVFQNTDDRDTFVGGGMVRADRAVIVPGNGIDLDRFRPSPEPEGTPLVVLPARLLRDKGVAEFVEAARRLKSRGVAARFALVGDAAEGNPAAVPEATLRGWIDAGLVEWWGHRKDMPAVFQQAHVVCLPSYREGMPQVLIEAQACARAVVTTDVPGCRDAVRSGQTGLLVRKGDADSLAEALGQLLSSPDQRLAMAAAGRRFVETTFDPKTLIGTVLSVYRSLRSDSAI
jgi:glycosyltransferase involved in cell wall biosynthesis